MILSLGDITSRATTLAGGRLDWGSSEASFWANLALEQVLEASGAGHIPREAIAISSTTSGGNRVALPTDFHAPLTLTLYAGSNSTATTSRTTTVYPLKQRDTAFLDAQSPQFSGGVPEYYAWFGTWIELFPSPDSSYSLQLRYVAKQGTLVASTDTPALDARWHQAWLYKTTELLEASRANPEGEALARNRYLSYVATLQTDRGLRQSDRKSMTLRFGGKRGRLD